MSLIHDIVKMQFVRYGYLPNHPYHMISDSEMCDAFLSRSTNADDTNLSGYFVDTYPCPSLDLKQPYDLLIDNIVLHINRLKSSNSDQYVLPDWIYSYMLGVVVGPNSNLSDIHDLLVLLNLDNVDDIFTSAAANACYEISRKWLQKPSNDDAVRCATMFGEPHVIKSLRVSQSGISR